MGSASVTTIRSLLLICIFQIINSSQAKEQNCQVGEFGCGDGVCIERGKVCDGSWNCRNGQDEQDCSMQGILQNVGNQKTARFPVYKTVQGFDIYLRFTAVKCTGSLLEITSRDTKEFLRVTLLEVGPIRVSFNTARGKGQLDVAMPSKGSFCDGKRHSFTLNVFQGRVFYNVDRSPHVRFYVSRLRAPFSSPDKIALGRGLQGCISGSTVINRFNRTEEHVMSMSAGCSVIKTTVRPTKPPAVFTSNVMARKIAAGQECKLLTLTACKSLGYILTQVPNALQHRTSHEASSELLALLSKLQPNCSPHLIPFLCQLYLPPCVLPQSTAPPCRSLCESVQEDCALVDRWPEHLSCERFPRANDKAKCFLGSTKMTSKRTTMIRGEIVPEEYLTDANSLKEAKGSPTKPVKNDQTTANPEPEPIGLENKSTPKQKVITDVKGDTFKKQPSTTTPITTATKAKPRQMTGGFVSAETKRTRGLRPTRGQKAPSKTMPVYKRNETKVGNATSPRSSSSANTISHLFNFTTRVLPSSGNKAGVCGGLLASPKGQLMSPGYPAGYPSNTTCRWVIALPNDYHAISFTFHRVYLEEDRNCVYDYIAVYDMLDNQVGQRYCGSITSPIHKDVKGNVAVVVFRSDTANSKKGFVLSYEARKCLTAAEVDN